MVKKIQQETKSGKVKVKTIKRKLIAILIFLLLIGGLAYLGVRYHKSQQDVKRLSNPTEAAKQETKNLVASVGKLVELPNNEDPTIATVKDITKLQSQAFFKSAKNDDKVLIYTQAKKAVLYRPSTNKVIEVAPVNIGNTAQPTTVTPAATP